MTVREPRSPQSPPGARWGMAWRAWPLAAALLLGSQGATAAPGDLPVPKGPPPKAAAGPAPVEATLPARGLFQGEQLTPAAQSRLIDLIIDTKGRNIELVLLVPTGPWNLDGTGRDERDLTPARIESLRRFLADRGVERKRTIVESRVDKSLREPVLKVQVIEGRSGD